MSDPWIIVGWLVVGLLSLGAVLAATTIVAAFVVRHRFSKAVRHRAKLAAARPASQRTTASRFRA